MGPVTGDRFEVDTSSARPAPKPCPTRSTKRTALGGQACISLAAWPPCGSRFLHSNLVLPNSDDLAYENQKVLSELRRQRTVCPNSELGGLQKGDQAFDGPCLRPAAKTTRVSDPVDLSGTHSSIRPDPSPPFALNISSRSINIFTNALQSFPSRTLTRQQNGRPGIRLEHVPSVVNGLAVVVEGEVGELLLALEGEVEVAALLEATGPEQEVRTPVRQAVQSVSKVYPPERNHDLLRVVVVHVLGRR
jgi:hypothetical protein